MSSSAEGRTILQYKSLPQSRDQKTIQLTCPSPRTLFVSAAGLENAKKLVTSYKTGEAKVMTPEIWNAKKVVDSTLHPGKTHTCHIIPFHLVSGMDGNS